MALKLPTTLGNPALPQVGGARRVASINSGGLGNDIVEGSKVLGSAWHRTADGLQKLGQAYDNLQLEADQKEAKDWLAELIKSKTALLYGDGTEANPGYMNLKGDAAVKGAKTANEQLQKLRADLLGKASNKQVAKIFDAATVNFLASDQEEILKHASKEHLVSLDTTDLNTITAATDLLSANPTDPTTEQNATALIVGSVEALLKRQGITDTVVRNQKVIEAVSAAKAQAIQTALVRDPKAGALLYAQWKDQIQGTDQAKLEQSIVQAEDRQMRREEHAFNRAIYMQNQFKSQEEDRLADLFLKGELDVDTIYNSGADGSAKITFANALRTRDKEGQEIVGNSDLFIDVFKRIGLPKDNPDRITSRSEYIGLIGKDGGLSEEQISKLDTEFTKSNKENEEQLKSLKDQWLKTARQELTGENEMLGLKDPKGQRNLASALSWMITEYDKLKKQGLSDLEIFDPNSPRSNSMYNGLKQFKREPKEFIRDMFEANPGSTSLSIDKAEAIKNLPIVNSQTDYDNLPVGSEYQYKDAQGNIQKGTKKK